MTKEVTLSNGVDYRFFDIFPDFIVTECFYDGRWRRIGREFKSFEQADKWVEEMNEKLSKPDEWFKSTAITDNPYNGSGEYCGD